MSKTSKRNVILSALLTMALCVSLIAGGTFALFTSESEVNIAVSSGKVQVTATVNEESVQTKQLNVEYAAGMKNLYEGTAVFSEEGLALNKLVPGDAIKFNIEVANESTVTVKYRTIIVCEADDGLFAGLNVKIGGTTYNGTTAVDKYAELSVGSEKDVVEVEIELPETAKNDYQEKSCTIVYKVEAIQGNAEVEDPDENTVYIYNAQDLMALSATVNTWQNGESKTIEFLNDIDLGSNKWSTVYFSNKNVTILGNGHSISSLTAPLFNFYGGTLTVNRLTIEDSTVNANGNDADMVLGAGAMLEQAQWANLYMNDCHVLNTTVNGNARSAALVGYWIGGGEIKSCSAEGCVVTATEAAAGIVGHRQGQQPDYEEFAKITDCTVKNTELTSTGDTWATGSMIGTIVGGPVAIADCDSVDNTLVQTACTNPDHELYGRIVGDCTVSINGVTYLSATQLAKTLSPKTNYSDAPDSKVTVTLDSDYVVTGDWTPLTYPVDVYKVRLKTLVIDGNGHTISGLTEPLVKHGVAQNYIFNNLTIADSVIDSGDGNDLGRGAFLACADNTCFSLTITDCKLLNSTVTSSFMGTGAFVGYVSDGQKLLIEGCTVDGCTISGSSAVGGILGFRQMSAGTSEVVGCTVKDTTLSGRYVGAVAGRITASGTLTINDFTNGTSKSLVGNVYASTAKVVVDGVEQA